MVRIVADQESLDACFAVRREVFCVEQNVSEELEWDGLDEVCTHFIALPEEGAPADAALGTARLWISEEGKAKAQRVAVHKRARGQGIGHLLMAALEAEAARLGHQEVILGAQVSALGFYEKRGYQAYGDLFDDAGIPHRMMKLSLG